MATLTPYGHEPSLWEKFSTKVSRDAPHFFGRLIQHAFHWLWLFFRFLGQMISDARGK